MGEAEWIAILNKVIRAASSEQRLEKEEGSGHADSWGEAAAWGYRDWSRQETSGQREGGRRGKGLEGHPNNFESFLEENRNHYRILKKRTMLSESIL